MNTACSVPGGISTAFLWVALERRDLGCYTDTQIPRNTETQTLTETQLIQEEKNHTSEGTATTTYTLAQLAAAREEFFDGQRLRIAVEELQQAPLDLYLLAAVLQAQRLDRQRAPAGQSWQTPAWDFGRFAKAHPALIALPSDRALREATTRLGRDVWQRCFAMHPADAEMAFDIAWNECRHVPGYDPLTVAFAEAKAALERARADEIESAMPAGYDLFLTLSGRLQQLVGDTAFMLPCHPLASLFHCLPMTISRYRQKALRDGFLRVVKEHRFQPGGRGDATEFRFFPDAGGDPGNAWEEALS